MKITLSLILVTLTMVSGNPVMIAQPTLPEKYNLVVLPLKIANDSNEKKYFKEVKKGDKLIDQLIAKSARLQEEKIQMIIEIKKLKRINEFLKNNNDTVYLHDTIFKRRKFYQLFKN